MGFGFPEGLNREGECSEPGFKSAESRLCAKIYCMIPWQTSLMWDSRAVTPILTATREIGYGVWVRWGGTLTLYKGALMVIKGFKRGFAVWVG